MYNSFIDLAYTLTVTLKHKTTNQQIEVEFVDHCTFSNVVADLYAWAHTHVAENYPEYRWGSSHLSRNTG